MKNRLKDFILAILVGFWGVAGWWAWHHKSVSAMEFQEVPPYKFADLPHGRIYKTVHEGCELYIVESDEGTSAAPFRYAVTSGRGCH